MARMKLLAAAAFALAAALMPVSGMAQDATVGAQEIVPASLAEVPRNETLVLGWGVAGGSSVGVTNPWVRPGYTHQEGNVFMWEPLMYFGIYTNEYIPWLADSMDYNADFTALTIKLNKDAKWSDGTPVTSADVVYTLEGQKQYNTLAYHQQFADLMESATAVDDLTVEVKFTGPAPRFKFEVLSQKFDTGIEIVPKGYLSALADPTKDPGRDTIPHSGPYNIVAWNAAQKIYDRRDDWWAVTAGRVPAMPAPKRIIIVNILGQPIDTVAQRVVNNEFDSSVDMRAQVINNILAQNPNVQSWTGTDSPYGYLDWWPNSLWMNTQLEPFNDPNVRKAASLAINRDLINEILYEGAPIATIYPFPLYPNLQAFADSPEVKAEQEKYNPGAFDPEESARLMTEAGFTMNGAGLWEKDGKTIDATIQAFDSIHGDIAPVLAEMLRNAGFDSNVNFGTDAYQNMADGKAGFYMFGHGASLYDPFEALNLFHGKYSAGIGSSAGNNRFSRYNNPEFDAILDEIAPLASDDPKFIAGAAKALGIYWRDTIDIPVIQWLHRIPYNNTYFTNWPSASNPAMGTNGAFWAFTGTLVIAGLQATGAE